MQMPGQSTHSVSELAIKSIELIINEEKAPEFSFYSVYIVLTQLSVLTIRTHI